MICIASSSAELALRFVLANEHVSCALSGMSSMDMVQENTAVADNREPLSEDELKRVSRSLQENKKMADLYCTGCNYCMPCPHEVNIPLNFQLMNYHRVYGLTEYARDQYSQILRPQSVSARSLYQRSRKRRAPKSRITLETSIMIVMEPRFSPKAVYS